MAGFTNNSSPEGQAIWKLGHILGLSARLTHRNSNIIARSIFEHKEQWQIMFCWEMLNGWILIGSLGVKFADKNKGVVENAFNVCFPK